MNELKIPTNLEIISLNEQTDYRLIEIGKIKDYFDQETKEQQILIKKLSKYITGFDYTGKILAVFLTVFSGTNIFKHSKDKKRLLGLITSAFSLYFCLGSGIFLKVLHKTKIRKKKKHNKLLYLANDKLGCVEMLVSQAIINQIISHDEFKAIMNGKKKTMTCKKLQ